MKIEQSIDAEIYLNHEKGCTKQPLFYNHQKVELSKSQKNFFISTRRSESVNKKHSHFQASGNHEKKIFKLLGSSVINNIIVMDNAERQSP